MMMHTNYTYLTEKEAVNRAIKNTASKAKQAFEAVVFPKTSMSVEDFVKLKEEFNKTLEEMLWT